ncbi:uncharacterized protein LOC132552231 [Ylistrum balloti]|uniref:uncharacterized protein LOC132552231 n=1 Tax=Ylistrum balloti TaxID=509963 RepID=UPI002905BAD8|nr:uncharacterized protein LOC132552231 [Ylistrum balloti]
MTPLCLDNIRPTLFLVPQTSRSCSVIVATPFNVTRIRLRKGLSRRLVVDCVNPKWNSLGEIGGQIRSSCEITVYVEYENDNYLVHPIDIAGNMYTVVVPSDRMKWQCFTIIYPIRNATNVTIITEAPTSGEFIFDDSSWAKFDSKYKMMITVHEFEAVYIKCTCNLSGVEIISPNAFMVVAGALLKQSSLQAIIVEQLSPTNTWGRQFLLPIPTLVNITATIYIVGKNDTGDLFINTNSMTDSFVSISSFPYTLKVAADEYIHIISPNSSVLPMVLMEAVNSYELDRFVYMSLPSVSQCLPRYRFNDKDNRKTTLSVWGTFGYNFLINFKNMTMETLFKNLTHDDVYLYANLENYENFEIIPQRRISLFPSVCGIVEILRNESVRLYSLGMRLTNVYESCVISGKRTVSADGNDNDCDGLVDEEIRNRRDDDGDGFVDEDIGTWVNSRRQVGSGESFRLEMSVIAVIISIVVALVAVLAFIGGMLLADQLMGGNTVAPVIDSPDLQ